MNEITFRNLFESPSAWGVGLAILFGVAALVPFMPRKLKSLWLWLILLGGAVVYIVSFLRIQIPLQNLTYVLLNNWLGVQTYERQILFTAIPSLLIGGLVQEAAKLVPILVYWWADDQDTDPVLGISTGAMCGVGFGVFEAMWVLNSIFASGFAWSLVSVYGFEAIAGIWERFFMVLFNTSSTAVIGWGLRKRRGWQFYLLAIFLHSFIDYGAVVFQAQKLSLTQVGIVIAILALIAFGFALWLRWRKEKPVEAVPSGPLPSSEIPTEAPGGADKDGKDSSGSTETQPPQL